MLHILTQRFHLLLKVNVGVKAVRLTAVRNTSRPSSTAAATSAVTATVCLAVATRTTAVAAVSPLSTQRRGGQRCQHQHHMTGVTILLWSHTDNELHSAMT